MAGAGVASTTASAPTVRPADDDGPPVAGPLEPAGRCREPHVDAPLAAGPTRAPATRDAMPPSSDQKSGGPSGSAAGTSARSARMRPPRRWAAARSGGKVAAADMSSTEPAWMPPIRGSTRTSTTWWPSLRATRGPMERSPIGPRTSGRGSTASRARPTSPRTPRTPLRAVGQNRVGMPMRVPLGECAQAPAGPHGRAPRRRWAPARRRAPLRGTARSPRAAVRGNRRGPCRRRVLRGDRCAAGRRGSTTPRARPRWARRSGARTPRSAPRPRPGR